MYLLRIFALVGLLSLSACGFKPIYAVKQGGSTSTQLQNIVIAPAGDRTTQLVRNSLISQFSNSGESESPQYFLTLTISEAVSSVLVRRTTDIQRSNLTLRAQYRLQTADRRTVLTSGNTVSIASYNRVSRDFGTISHSEFANVSAEKDARKRAAVSVAEDITRRLSAFLATRS